MRIISRGELGYRLTQSYSRLECEHYLPDVVWTKDKNSWPGDWEGRTMLGLVGLAKATGKEPSYLEDMLELLPQKLNERGYMGEIYPDGKISEQQLAGNSWLLRTLIEYTNWKKSNRLLPYIERMVKNLYLPISDDIKDYPTEKYEKEGEYSGSIIAIRGKWMLSTDVGCAYISMDGISAAYQLLGWEELAVLLDRMIEKFSNTDLYGLCYQTHASLSATRGIIRTYILTQKKEYLDIAQSVFDLYLSKGQTENFSNRNRFQTCRWTEPCGFIDSYMCCIELYKITKEEKYIAMAHKIYFNSISHSQLSNGGFGLEKAIISDESIGFIKRKSDGKVAEAYWCCTMRGADGLSYVSQNQCLINGNEFTFLNYFDSEITDDNLTIAVKSYYPNEGRVRFTISNIKNSELKLNLYIPDYAKKVKVLIGNEEYIKTPENSFLHLVIDSDTVLTINFDIPLIEAKCNNEELQEDYCKWMHGYLLIVAENVSDDLGKPVLNDNGEYIFNDNISGCYLNKTVMKNPSYSMAENLRIVFKKS